VVNISWTAAMAYCDWLNKTSGAGLPDGYIFSLPSEAEWEKAARGEFAFEYPWGNEFDPAKCNTAESKIGTTTPVGTYSDRGDSPYGCADMAGNVWEWTRSLFKPYPYQPGDGREDLQAGGPRVLRGGSFGFDRRIARCACRIRGPSRPLGQRLRFSGGGCVSHLLI
jgi:toxoflavin biosynthesis protein ToxD